MNRKNVETKSRGSDSKNAHQNDESIEDMDVEESGLSDDMEDEEGSERGGKVDKRALGNNGTTLWDFQGAQSRNTRGGSVASSVAGSRKGSSRARGGQKSRRNANNTKNVEEDEDEESSGDENEDEDNDDDEDNDEDEDDEEEEEEGDDSSDMDSQECEKKRSEFMEDLTDLEKQFAILREQLYRERKSQIESKLAEVRAGRAPEYLQPLEELQFNMKNRMEVGVVLRELRLTNIQCKYDAEMLATEQNYVSEKELLMDSLKADLEEKIHMLEEDKHNVDFSSGLWEQSSWSRKRKGDFFDHDRRKKPVTVTGPYIVYMLTETDILDDWTAIKKSLTTRKKT